MTQRRKRRHSENDLFKMQPVELYKKILSGEVSKFPKGYMKQENIETLVSEIGQFLFEDILNWSIEDVKTKTCMNIIYKYKLGSIIKKSRINTIHKFVNTVYPGKIKPWDLNITNWGNKDVVKDALRDICINRHGFKEKEDFYNVSIKFILENGVSNRALTYFDNSLINAMLYSFPELELLPWKFKNCPVGYWDSKENCSRAILYLMNEELKIDEKDFVYNFNANVLRENKLSGLLGKFNGSPYLIIETVFPGKYKKSDMKSYNGRRK